jgi:hypothetical protein
MFALGGDGLLGALAKLRQDVLQAVGPLLRGLHPQQKLLGVVERVVAMLASLVTHSCSPVLQAFRPSHSIGRSAGVSA